MTNSNLLLNHHRAYRIQICSVAQLKALLMEVKEFLERKRIRKWLKVCIDCWKVIVVGCCGEGRNYQSKAYPKVKMLYKLEEVFGRWEQSPEESLRWVEDFCKKLRLLEPSLVHKWAIGPRGCAAENLVIFTPKLLLGKYFSHKCVVESDTIVPLSKPIMYAPQSPASSAQAKPQPEQLSKVGSQRDSDVCAETDTEKSRRTSKKHHSSEAGESSRNSLEEEETDKRRVLSMDELEMVTEAMLVDAVENLERNPGMFSLVLHKALGLESRVEEVMLGKRAVASEAKQRLTKEQEMLQKARKASAHK